MNEHEIIARIEALEAMAGLRPQPQPQPQPVPAHKAYATKAITPKVAQFAEWVEREFPELYPQGLDDRDVRLVMITNKAYSHFQAEVNGRS
jgi:hypothetical protein